MYLQSLKSITTGVHQQHQSHCHCPQVTESVVSAPSAAWLKVLRVPGEEESSLVEDYDRNMAIGLLWFAAMLRSQADIFAMVSLLA